MTVTTARPSDTAAPTRRRRPVGEPPPLPHEFSRSGWVLIIAASAVATLWILGATVFRELGIWFNEVEGVYVRWVVDHRVGWLTEVLNVVHSFFYSWSVPLIGWTTMLLLLAARRFRHLLVYFGALMVTTGIVVSMMPWIGRPRPWMVEQLVAWEGYSHPSLAVAQLTAVCVGAAYALIPGGRNRVRAGVLISVVVAIFGFSRVYFGVEYPMDPLNGAIIGAAIMSAGFLLICPEAAFPVGFQRGRTAHLDVTGPRGDAIRAALKDQLGLEVRDVKPVGLAESAGSTPMRITVAGKLIVAGSRSSAVFAKLYATNHLRSDRWYKLGRALLYGRLEDESRFQNVRRLVEREDYLMRTMRDAGVRIPEPLGIAEITPEREYLIVTEFLEGAEELTTAEIDDDIVDKALAMVRNMWDHGLAHRDIKPANIMIRPPDAYVIDVSFGQIRPSPWREAVDLGNMMLALALRSSPELVYVRALKQFSQAEITEAFAATRGVTMPSQLRRELKNDPRDLFDEFHSLAHPGDRLRIQRWTLRRIGLLLWATLVAMFVILFGVGNLAGIGLL